jgi:diketogulonate reductase-like aldo/keto reductase
VSNVSLEHLEQMVAAHSEPPAFVQNRCFARIGWDRDVRAFCTKRNIVYQGFSLLTANRQIMQHERLAALASQLDATPAQVVFSFASTVGMLPMTGTSSAEHMQQDLASLDLTLPPDVVDEIESIAN